MTPYSNSLFDNSIAGEGRKDLPSSAGSTGLEGPSCSLVEDAIQIWPSPWASQGSPAELEPVVIQQASAWGPGVELPSLAPKGQAGYTETVIAMDTVGSPHKARGPRWSPEKGDAGERWV